MGCQQTKDPRNSFKKQMQNMEDAASVAEEQRSDAKRLDTSIASSQDTVMMREASKLSLGGRPRRERLRKLQEVNSDTIKELLKAMRANDEQMEFWDVWAKYMHDRVLGDVEGVFHRVFVHLDMRWLEIHLIAEKDLLVSLLRRFLQSIGCWQQEERKAREDEQTPEQRSVSWKRMFDDMTMVLDGIERLEKQGKSLKIKVWCRFKHMRSNNPRPGIDFGFLVRQENLQWSFLDVLLHPTEDSEVLRSFCCEHGREAREAYHPQWYGSTLVPTNPERLLGFEIKESVATNYKQIILQAFFFFKAMGLMKPEDAVVKTLQKAGSSRIHIDASFGPNGLVRISLSIFNLLERSFNRDESVTPQSTIKELATQLDLGYNEQEIHKIQDLLGGQPDIIDYVAETNGYGLRMGYTYPM